MSSKMTVKGLRRSHRNAFLVLFLLPFHVPLIFSSTHLRLQTQNHRQSNPSPRLSFSSQFLCLDASIVSIQDTISSCRAICLSFTFRLFNTKLVTRRSTHACIPSHPLLYRTSQSFEPSPFFLSPCLFAHYFTGLLFFTSVEVFQSNTLRLKLESPRDSTSGDSLTGSHVKSVL